MRILGLAGLTFLAAMAGAGAAKPTGPQFGRGDSTETKQVLVDAVVTTMKGNYVPDLSQKDFKVLEDGKEQSIHSFAVLSRGVFPNSTQPHYLVLFFDNSTMSFSDQAVARRAAGTFVDSMPGLTVIFAIVNFSGGLQIAQHFTPTRAVKQVVSGVKLASRHPNAGTIAVGGRRLDAVRRRFGQRLTQLIDRCGSAVWATRFVAGVARLGQRIGSGPGPQDPGAVHRRLPAEHGDPVRGDRRYGYVQQSECVDLSDRRARPGGSGSGDRSRSPALGRAGAACRRLFEPGRSARRHLSGVRLRQRFWHAPSPQPFFQTRCGRHPRVARAVRRVVPGGARPGGGTPSPAPTVDRRPSPSRGPTNSPTSTGTRSPTNPGVNPAYTTPPRSSFRRLRPVQTNISKSCTCWPMAPADS